MKIKKNIKEWSLIILLFALFPLIFKVLAAAEHNIKDMTMNVTGVTETPLSKSVYKMTNNCGFFTSKSECFEAVKIQIELSKNISDNDKNEAYIVAKRIIFLISGT